MRPREPRSFRIRSMAYRQCPPARRRRGLFHSRIKLLAFGCFGPGPRKRPEENYRLWLQPGVARRGYRRAGRAHGSTGRTPRAAGMDPIKACGAQDWLSAQPGDTLLWYLSEVDTSRKTTVEADWMRPLMSPAGWRNTVASLDDAVRAGCWRPLVDWRLRPSLNFGACAITRSIC